MIPEELVLTLKCSGIRHRHYWRSQSLSLLLVAAKKICLWLERQSWRLLLPKTPRKNLAAGIKRIQIMPHGAAGYKDPVIQGCLYLWKSLRPISWTYARTMTTGSKSPEHTWIWHWLQFINSLIQCQTSSFLTFVASVYQILAFKKH